MKMIKWLAMIGVAGLAVTLLTGCGQGNSYDDEIVARELADREVEKRYCVIDVSSGPSSSQYPVRYERSIPEQAKTTQIVLRWLPAEKNRGQARC